MVSKSLVIFILLVTMTTVLARKPKYQAFGKRQSHDHLIQRKIIKIPGKFLRTPRKLLTFWGDKISDITQIRIIKKGIFSKKPKARIIMGGPGFKFVTIYFKNSQSRGIHAIVELYGKPMIKWDWKNILKFFNI